MTHKQDMDYYRQCKRTDPSFTVEVAVREYLNQYPAVAVDIAYQIWSWTGDNSTMTNDEMWDLINSMESDEAFRQGQFSERVMDSDYVRIDGYGHFVELSEYEYEESCRDDCLEAMQDIIDGKYEIPDKLQEVIDLFADPDDSGYVANRKPVKKSTARKKTSKTKSTPSTASGNRKPVSKKKAPAKTAKKKTGGRRR